MRVLHVVPSLAKGRGGPRTVLASLAPALLAHGVDVEVLTTTADLDDAEDARIVASFAPVPVSFARVTGPARLDLAPTLPVALARRIGACDVVHLHTVFTFPLAAAACVARVAGKPYVVRPAGTLDETCLRGRSYLGKRIALATWVGALLHGAAAVHSTSTLETRELARWVEREKIREIELGADAFELPPDRGERGTRLLSLGRLDPMKGLERLIDAMSVLPEDVTLTIAGSGDAAYGASLQARARGRRVRFVGHVEDEAKHALLAEADLCVFPSRHESFGLAIVEAMAAGRAVVVTDGVGIADVIADARAGVVSGIELAATIEELLTNGAERAKVAERGRVLARQRWSWSAAAERTIALYEELLLRR